MELNKSLLKEEKDQEFFKILDSEKIIDELDRGSHTEYRIFPKTFY